MRKKSLSTKKRIISSYNNFTIIVVNTIIFFVALNLGSLFFLKPKTDFHNHVLTQYSIDSLQIVYPNFNKQQIKKLLNETWSRSYEYEPYTQFKEGFYNGEYVNINKNGFREGEEKSVWPIDTNHYNIFLFGGSTTFGYGVSDSNTISSHLQELLKKSELRNISIYNFGRGFYSSFQERILFENQMIQGNRPDLVIFIDGLNDFGFSHQPVFTEKIQQLFIEKNSTSWDIVNCCIKKIPVIQLILERRTKREKKTLSSNFDTNNYTMQDSIKAKEIIKQYLNNKNYIENGAKFYDIKTLFIWQPVPYFQYNNHYHLFSQDIFFRRELEIGYNEMEINFRDSLLGKNFLWLADLQKEFLMPLYVDNVHYTSEFSRIIAKKIEEKVVELQLLRM